MSEDGSSSDSEIVGDMFADPEGYFPPPPKSQLVEYRTPLSHRTLRVGLLGKHPLWGHLITFSAREMALLIESDAVAPKLANACCIELGAGGGVPSLVAILHQPKLSVITDYPDDELIDNIRQNVLLNFPAEALRSKDHRSAPYVVEGHLWGRVDECESLKAYSTDGRGYDFVLMADIIFNHSEHSKLLQSVEHLLAPGGIVYITYTSHRVKWKSRDEAFFPLAVEHGFEYHEFEPRVVDRPLFPDEVGDELIRRTIRRIAMWRRTDASQIPKPEALWHTSDADINEAEKRL